MDPHPLVALCRFLLAARLVLLVLVAAFRFVLAMLQEPLATWSFDPACLQVFQWDAAVVYFKLPRMGML